MHGLMSYQCFGRARSLRSDRALRSDRTSVRARSLHSDRADVATEVRLELGRYVATERNGRLVATRYVATKLRLELGRYVATERSTCLVAA
ncbi:hypothetical protein F2Q70_00031510 [Brassica cretica]|uniref:Uncharacterized protein n=1 Tax=Brassica cretica TaxID=69181 RepID=A0A8S9FJQ4_BRACR|nr:hypothetical protein F2Q70_00031510 [Brassica cretica]